MVKGYSTYKSFGNLNGMVLCFGNKTNFIECCFFVNHVMLRPIFRLTQMDTVAPQPEVLEEMTPRYPKVDVLKSEA